MIANACMITLCNAIRFQYLKYRFGQQIKMFTAIFMEYWRLADYNLYVKMADAYPLLTGKIFTIVCSH